MLRKVTLELTVLDYDRIGGSDPIGKVRLGYSRKKLEKKHWAEMVENPRRPVIHWHVLQVKIEIKKKIRENGSEQCCQVLYCNTHVQSGN